MFSAQTHTNVQATWGMPGNEMEGGAHKAFASYFCAANQVENNTL